MSAVGSDQVPSQNMPGINGVWIIIRGFVVKISGKNITCTKIINPQGRGRIKVGGNVHIVRKSISFASCDGIGYDKADDPTSWGSPVYGNGIIVIHPQGH